MSYTVSLELPDCAERADFDHEPTPLEAVESFRAQVEGSGDNYVYVVTEDKPYGRKFLVDMAMGPSVKQVETPS